MKKWIFIIGSILVWMIGLSIGKGVARAAPSGPPPDIAVILSLADTTVYPGDPIIVTLSLENVGSQDEIMDDIFSGQDFHLLLRFYDETGRVITSDISSEVSAPTPPIPRVFRESGGKFPQGIFVEVIPSGVIVTYDPFDAYEYYPLEGRSGHFRVQAVFSARTFLDYQETATGVKYAKIYPPLEDQTKWVGSLKSNIVSFTKVDDADGDGYYYPLAHDGKPADCDDTNMNTHPGAEEILGDGIDNDCNPATPDVTEVAAPKDALIQVEMDRHVVGTGSHPGSVKYPCPGAYVRAFDKSSGSCVSQYGVSWHHYETIWFSCSYPEPDGAAKTNADGIAEVAVRPGNYLVIGVYDPDGELNNDGDEVFMGVSVGDVASGETVYKYLQMIEKQDGKKGPAKYTKRKGSELLIIEPEYVEWDGTVEYYPFVFESIGDWDVATAVSPPEGFVADNDILSEDVNTEREAVQFTITDVGSKWTDTEVTYNLKHKSKKHKIKSKIGVKLSKKLAKKKGLDIYGKKIKKNK
jgi:Putative metal-binding motif